VKISQEGIVKFQTEFTPASPLPPGTIAELSAWRQIMYLLKLIGAGPDGIGFGNISCRVMPLIPDTYQDSFIITGTGTGTVPLLDGSHFTIVSACHTEENLVVATGPISPSAESMTHGVVYAQDRAIKWVIHSHSPAIWHNRTALELPSTAPDIPYGSVEMTREVARLFNQTDVAQRGIFAMDGHEDGIVSFAESAEKAAAIMINTLARALQPA
jgi:hypothetical protein